MSQYFADGGPAFPITDASTAHRVGAAAIEGITDAAERDRVYIAATGRAAQGMSLRDYFAAKAMQAAATNSTGAEGFTFEERASWAYQQADAMLKAREAT